MTLPLDWRPTAHARRLVSLTLFALLLGLIVGRPAVAALAAVPVAFLCRPRRVRPASASMRIVRPVEACFEDEPMEAGVRVSLDHAVDVLAVTIDAGPFAAWDQPRATAAEARQINIVSELRMRRWGRRRLGTLVATFTADGGLRRAVVHVDLGELATFPQPTPASRVAIAALRGGLAGDHRARRAGPGTEFAAIRPYGPGDSPARVNWPISLRLQRLHVTQRLTEDAVDVVLVVDAFADVGPAGRSSLDLSVRGVTGLAQALLRDHDRVGVIAIGGWLRWLRPDSGTRQFYRVAATVLDVLGRFSYLDPDVGRLPPRAVPSGARVVLFSPLTDRRALDSVEQLRTRGLDVTVVDVLTGQPAAREPVDQLARRLWLLDREATAQALAELGVPVVNWDGASPLDAVLAPALTGRWAVRR